jgi:hypothetical protein
MVAGQAGGDFEPEGGVMTDGELFLWWLAALALPVAMVGFHCFALIRRRRRLGLFELLGAEVERLNRKKKQNT